MRRREFTTLEIGDVTFFNSLNPLKKDIRLDEMFDIHAGLHEYSVITSSTSDNTLPPHVAPNYFLFINNNNNPILRSRPSQTPN